MKAKDVLACLGALSLVLFSQPVSGGAYTLAGESNLATGSSCYGWDGSCVSSPVTAIGNSANFGPGGVFPTAVLTPALDDTTNFTGINGFVSSWWDNSTITPTQISQVLAFFNAGGDLVLLDDDSGHDAIGEALGLPTQPQTNSLWTGNGGPLFNGPFGSASTINADGNIGYFNLSDITNNGGSVGATDNSSNPTIGYWVAHVFCPTCGALILVGDVDTWGEANFGPNDANGTVVLNSVAFLISNSGNFNGTIAAAPEPTTLLLMGVGLLGLGLVRRKPRK